MFMMYRRPNFFYRMATMTQAGVTIAETFRMLAESEGGLVRRGFESAQSAIDLGEDLKAALRAAHLFRPFEIEIVAAGETAGRLPEVLHKLAGQAEEKVRRVNRLILYLAYPVLILHVAILAPQLVVWVQNGGEAYLAAVLPGLMALYMPVVSLLMLCQLAKALPPLAALLDRVALNFPLGGRSLLRYELASSVGVFEGLYSSGVPIVGAMASTVRVTDNSVLRALWERVHGRLRQGQNLESATRGEQLLPKYLRDFISTGERSGHLDETLRKACAILEEEGDNSVKRSMAALTAILFVIAAGLVAYKVITFYMGMFSRIGELGG